MKRTLRGLLGLLGGASVACAGGVSVSETVGQLPSGFVAAAILEDPTGGPLLFGYGGGASTPVAQRRTALWRIAGGEASEVMPSEPGWFVAAARSGAQIWGVRAAKDAAQDGNRYTVVVSENGGQDWEARGDIPSESVTALAVSEDGWGWAGGVADLWRTTDGGRTWSPVVVPGSRGVQKPNFAAPAPGVVLVGGPTLRRSGDGGETWVTLSADEVLATDGAWVAGTLGDGVRLGRIEGDAVAWRGSLDEALLPDALVSDGDKVVVRAAPTGKDVGRYVALIVSVDGGETLGFEKLRGPSSTATVGLGDGQVWRLTQDRALKRLTLKED